jgi:hypothetical protein
MRILFYCLLLVNLMFVIWKFGFDRSERHAQEAPSRVAEPSESQGSALTPDQYEMLPLETSALSNGQQLPEVELEAVIENCGLIGPINDRKEAEAMLPDLLTLSKEAQIIARPLEVAEGWWVIFPKAATREVALANRQMLINRGFYENWLFDDGPQKFAISLGIYPTPEEAEAAAKSIRDKGIGVKVVPREVLGSRFWVKMVWAKPLRELDEAIQLINTQDGAAKIPSPIACH